MHRLTYLFIVVVCAVALMHSVRGENTISGSIQTGAVEAGKLII